MRFSKMSGLALTVGVLWGAGIATAQASLPSGYRLAQELKTANGDSLQILEDSRITPELQTDMWGNSTDPDTLGDDALAAKVKARPFLQAQALIVSASGEIKAQKALGYPMAMVEPAPFKDLPSPVYFLTVDETAPMGSLSGPATEVLVPAEHGLEPITYVTEEGKVAPFVLAQTGKAAWQVAPIAAGAVDQIEQVSSASTGAAAAGADDDGDGDSFVTTYRTYRYAKGQWSAVSRQKNEYWESEGDFPLRSAFP